jgi:hypothetical protein
VARVRPLYAAASSQAQITLKTDGGDTVIARTATGSGAFAVSSGAGTLLQELSEAPSDDVPTGEHLVVLQLSGTDRADGTLITGIEATACEVIVVALVRGTLGLASVRGL